MPRSDKSPYDAQQNHDAKHHSQNHVYREERAVVIGREGNSGRYDEADCQQPVEDPVGRSQMSTRDMAGPLLKVGSRDTSKLVCLRANVLRGKYQSASRTARKLGSGTRQC